MLCVFCGEAFTPTTRHRRKYCDLVCLMTACRLRYRSKPEIKAKLAAARRRRREEQSA